MQQFVGGAHAGFMRATWPFATLKVSARELVLDVKLVGEYRLRPEDVAELEIVHQIPVLSQGVAIRHVRKDTPADLTFWCFGDPRKIIAAVAEEGFIPNASRADLPDLELPFRVPFLIAWLALLHLAFLLDHSLLQASALLGPAMLSAFALLMLTSLLVKTSPRFSRLALRSPDALLRAKPALNAVAIGCALLLLGALVLSFAPPFIPRSPQ